jgi:hypothetical protein
LSRLATSFVLAYHGCDKEIAENAISGKLELKPSDSKYDWLGSGICFWESDQQRALEWAKEPRNAQAIKEPAVIGAVIDLGNCLDLVSRESLELVELAYNSFAKMRSESNLPLPENKKIKTDPDGDRLLRFLDYAVIEHLHQMIGQMSGEGKLEPFDTVRGMFTEGAAVYPGAAYFTKSHVQIAVRNTGCIKGMFYPRSV